MPCLTITLLATGRSLQCKVQLLQTALCFHAPSLCKTCSPHFFVPISSSSFRSLTVTLLAAGKSLVCTVWPHKAHNFPNMPQRLGIVHCVNRPCSLYSVTIPYTCKNNTPSDLNPQAQLLTEGLLSAMSPKFSPSGDRLVFLSHDAAASSGVHAATAALKSIQWSSGDVYTFCLAQ